jgi:hypothetical protein
MLVYYLPIYLTLFVVLLASIIVISCVIAVYYTNKILAHIDPILKSYDDFMSLHDRDRYFSKRDLNSWNNRWNGIRSVIQARAHLSDFKEKNIGQLTRRSKH